MNSGRSGSGKNRQERDLLTPPSSFGPRSVGIFDEGGSMEEPNCENWSLNDNKIVHNTFQDQLF